MTKEMIFTSSDYTFMYLPAFLSLPCDVDISLLSRCACHDHWHYTVKKKVELYTKNGGSVTFTLYMRCDITLH